MNVEDRWTTNEPIDDRDRGQLSCRPDAGTESTIIRQDRTANDLPHDDNRVDNKKKAISSIECLSSNSKNKCPCLSLEKLVTLDRGNILQANREQPSSHASVSSLSSSEASEQCKIPSTTTSLNVPYNSNAVPANVYLSSPQAVLPSILTPEMKAMYRQQVSQEIAEFARQKAEEKRYKRRMYANARFYSPCPCFCRQQQLSTINRRMSYPGATRPKANYIQHRTPDATTI